MNNLFPILPRAEQDEEDEAFDILARGVGGYHPKKSDVDESTTVHDNDGNDVTNDVKEALDVLGDEAPQPPPESNPNKQIKHLKGERTMGSKGGE